MEVNQRRVVWDKPAYLAFKEAFNHIRKDSFTAAERFREEVLECSKGLSINPERYPPDKFKTGNEGEFRAFEMYSYRIAYKITEREIVILRFRHVRREPRAY